EVFERFVRKAPFAVMTRILAQDFIGSHLDAIFDSNRELQYDYIVSFQAVAATVADVVLNFSDNFNQAYKEHQEELQVSRQSFYAKTRGVEPAVSEQIVKSSAERAVELQVSLDYRPWELLPDYRCFSIDGNVLPKSDK